MQTKQKFARRLRSLVENRLVLSLEEVASARVLERGSANVGEQAHLLVAPPGAGNIGDQAMIEAFVAGTTGRVVIVTRRPGDVQDLPDELDKRVTILVLPGLLYGLPHQHLRDMKKLAPALLGARSFSVVGADIMDGAYWESPSVRRFRLARLAAQRGINSRVLGFSWNASPTRAATRAMVAASQHLDLLARDAASARRLRDGGGKRIVDVADIAFLTVPRPLSDESLVAWCAARRKEGKRIVLYNVNALIEGSTGMVDTFEQLLLSETSRNVAFVAVPHVSRGTPSDVELARKLGKLANDNQRVFVIDRLLPPGEIATLASLADLSVTGRMHLTILSTSVGTPVVTVGYQGKVSGLYEVIGSDSWVDGGAVARAKLRELVEHALENLDELKAVWAQAMPRLVTMSQRNLDGLEGPKVAR